MNETIESSIQRYGTVMWRIFSYLLTKIITCTLCNMNFKKFRLKPILGLCSLAAWLKLKVEFAVAFKFMSKINMGQSQSYVGVVDTVGGRWEMHTLRHKRIIGIGGSANQMSEHSDLCTLSTRYNPKTNLCDSDLKLTLQRYFPMSRNVFLS